MDSKPESFSEIYKRARQLPPITLLIYAAQVAAAVLSNEQASMQSRQTAARGLREAIKHFSGETK